MVKILKPAVSFFARGASRAPLTAEAGRAFVKSFKQPPAVPKEIEEAARKIQKEIMEHKLYIKG